VVSSPSLSPLLEEKRKRRERKTGGFSFKDLGE
jgi:hypothetical protein